MTVFDQELLWLSVLAALWTAASILLHRRASARGITLYPLLLVARFSRTSEAVESIAKRFPRLKLLLDSSIVLAPVMMVVALAFLAFNVRSLLTGVGYAAVVPLVPFVTIRSPPLLELFLLAVPVLVIPHELFHALAARMNGIKVKSGGLAIVGVLFAGFVEPDEESMKASRWTSRAKLAGAGSMANALLGVALFLLLITQPYTYTAIPAPMANAFYGPSSGLMVIGLAQGYPAQLAGLRPGDVIVSLNGTPITSTWPGLQPGQLAVLGVRRGGELLTMGVKSMTVDNRTMLGFYAMDYRQPRLQLPAMGLGEFSALLWVMMISLSVAAFNMLPLYPFDGWLYVDSLLDGAAAPRFVKLAVLGALAAVSIGLLGGNIALTIFRYGGLPIV